MNSESPTSIHYEVYTQDNGPRWNLHARYERNERDTAMQDAKNVEKTLQIPAKVVRETYFSGNNMSEETVVYAGDPGLRAKIAARATASPVYRGRGGNIGGGSAAGGAGGRSFGGGARPAAAAPAASVSSAAKLMLVIAAALTVAGVATSLVNAMFDPTADDVSDTAQSVILFATFMVTFFAVALPLATSVLKWRMFGASASSGKKQRGTAVAASGAKKDSAGPAVPEVEPNGEPDWEGLKDEDEAIPAADPVAEEKVDSTEPAIETEEKKEKDESKAGVDAAVNTASFETFMRFVNGLVGAVRKTRPVLDAYNLFGVDLVMAGAIDLLGQNKHLTVEERRRQLKSAIEAMGVKAATAQAFADKYEEYLGEARYMPMILAGRTSMESYLDGQDIIAETVKPVFELWNKPQSQAPAAAARIMTVMFTDMVGSTDMTQAQGDQAAQNVVRRHNTIVRSALAQFAGKEIKHTGDGIMASFSSAASGVEATIAIQKAVAKYNASQPDQELHLRIGINAGEPIEEEEDLFGSTVQLAARVCARCDTDQILCTNVVKELSSGRGLTFNSLGAQELKGFKEQITLYRVEWK